MASPGRECDSSFDHILKNTEFENVQQIKAIKAEREKIKAYETQLKERHSQIVHLEKSSSGLDEHARQLHKQFSINRDNCESLKRTASVLADHEEALKAKVKTTEREFENERVQQSAALGKYDCVWDRYKTKYDSLEKAMELKSKEMEVQKLLQDNTAIEIQVKTINDALRILRHQDDDKLFLVSTVIKIAQFRVETDKNLQLAHTASKAVSTLQWEIDTLQDDLARVEDLVQEQQREIDRREQHYNNVKDNSPSVEAMEVDGTSSSGSNNSINHHPWPIQTDDNKLQRRSENQATDCNLSVSNAPIVPSQQTQRQGPATANVTVPLRTPGSLNVQPSSKKQGEPPFRYRLEIPKLCTPPRTSSRSLMSGTRPPATDVTSFSLSTPPQVLAASFTENRAVYPSANSVSTAPNFTISNSTIRKTVPKPVMPLLHTPTQSRPRVSLSMANVQQQVNPNSNTPSPVQHFTPSLKQPNTTSQPALLASQCSPTVSQPLPIIVSQSATPMNYTHVNSSFPHSLQTSQLTPQQPSSLSLNSLSLVQPPLSIVAPTQAQSMVSDDVRMDDRVRDGVTAPTVENCNEPPPVQSNDKDSPYENENTEHCDISDVRNNVTGFSGTEHNLFVCDTDTNDQLYTNYSDVGDGGCANNQEGEGFQDSNQGQAMFTDSGEAQLYYGLEGHLGGQMNQPDLSAGGTSSGFVEGFRFDQEPTDGGTGNMNDGFNIFGSDNMDLPKEPVGASDFSFSFGGSETANTGSFFF